MLRRPRPSAPPTHQHTWISVSSSSNYESFRTNIKTGERVGAGVPITLLLQRCRCGAHQTDTLNGRWTREELGIDDHVVADLMALLHETTPDEPGP
jgi:hypothetical protein